MPKLKGTFYPPNYLQETGHFTIGYHHCGDCEAHGTPPSIIISNPYDYKRSVNVQAQTYTVERLMNALNALDIDWNRLEPQDKQRLRMTLRKDQRGLLNAD